LSWCFYCITNYGDGYCPKGHCTKGQCLFPEGTIAQGKSNPYTGGSSNKDLLDTIFKSRPLIGDEHLALFCIHPDHQKKKLGQQLLSLSMSKVMQQGNKFMSLGVDLDNIPAYHIYRKLGFETQTKIINHEWKNPESARQWKLSVG
jgi:ribosomal protein S18 acetylase RimI-like enzyme